MQNSNCKIYFLVSIFALFAAYSAAVFSTYGFADDYEKLGLVFEQAFKRYAADGRILYAALLPIFSLANSLGDLWILRLISLIGCSLLSVSLACLYRGANWGVFSSIICSVLLIFTPPFTLYVGWASLYLFPFACILALYSGHCVSNDKQRYLVSFVLLFLSLCLYQPAVGFYWIAVLPKLLSEGIRQPDYLVNLIKKLLFFAGSVLIYLLVYRSGIWLSPSTRGSGVVDDLVARLANVFNYALLDSLSLFSITQNKIFISISALLILLGFVLRIVREPQVAKNLLIIYLLSFPLCYVPNIFAGVESFSFRTQAALHALVLLLCFVGVGEVFKLVCSTSSRGIKLFTSASVLLVFGYFARDNLNNSFIAPALKERGIILEILEEEFDACPKSLYVVRPTYEEALGTLRYDEFASPSTVQSWGPEVVLPILLKEVFAKCDGVLIRSGWEHNDNQGSVIDLASRFRARRINKR